MFESGLIIFDNNLRIVSLNNAVKRLIGESSLENAGLKFLETGVRSLNGERKKAPLKDFVISVLKEGTILNLRMKTGLNIVLESLRDENGAIKGASLILKNAESRYNKQRKCVHRSDNFAGDYLQKLLQSSNAAIVVFDNKGKFITFNPAAERLTGYTAAEMVGKQNICLIFPDREKIEQYKSSLFRNEKIEDAELPVKCKDGRFIHTLTSITMLRNDDSTPMGFMAVAVDISRRKELENELESHFQNLEKAVAERTLELKQTSDFLNQVLNSSHSYSIITTDSLMKITMFNTGAEKMFGYKDQDVAGADLEMLFNKEADLKIHEIIKIVYEKGFFEGEQDFIKNGGSKLVGLLTVTPLAGVSSTRVKGYLSIIRDITQQKFLEQQLIRSEKLAATGKMAASIAHEIINPLYGIQGCLKQLLEDLPLDYKNYDFVDVALRETYRIAGLLKQMQDFYRPYQERIVPSSVNLIIHEVLSLNRKFISSNKVRLTLDLQPNMPNIVVPFNQVKQVFINLLYNAVEAMPGGGSLIIKTRLEEDYITIQFTDTGIGIPSEDIDKIFEPFFTTKSEVRGVGLGLSVTYGIIKGHGGDISVSSALGEGTTFTVKLPLNPSRRR